MRWLNNTLNFATRLGVNLFATFESFINIVSFSSACIIRTPLLLMPANRQARLQLFHQLYRYGPSNLRGICVLSLLVSSIITLFAIVQFRAFGLHENAPSLVAILLSRQVCPLLVALLLLIKSGVTNTADLRKVDSQLKKQTVDTIIMPDVLALAVAGPLLLVYAVGVSLWCSYFVGTYFFNLSAAMYIQKMFSAVHRVDLIVALSKTISYGVLIGLLSAYYGLQVSENKIDLSSAIISTLTRSILAILVANIIIEYSSVFFV